MGGRRELYRKLGSGGSRERTVMGGGATLLMATFGKNGNGGAKYRGLVHRLETALQRTGKGAREGVGCVR